MPMLDGHIGNDSSPHIHIRMLFRIDDIFEFHGAPQIQQILAAGRFVIAKVGQVGHTACGQILAEALAVICIRVDSVVQLDKFRKGERIDHKLHIPSGQIGRQFAGKQFSIGTGDVNIAGPVPREKN